MKQTSRLIEVYERLIRGMFVLAGMILIAVTVAVTLGVVVRYFFNNPFGWVVELSSYALLFITFLVAPWVLREDRHVSVDIILNLFGPRLKALVQMVTATASAAVCLVLTWFGIRVSWDSFRSNNFTPTMLELPKGAILSIIFVGSFMLFIQLVRMIHRYQKELRSQPGPGLTRD